MPQFGNSLYNNPQMGSYGGSNPQGEQGWWNQSSPMSQWQNQFAPVGSAWESSGAQPGSFGGSAWYNPQTGQQATQSGDVLSGYYGSSNAITSTDPNTGESYINLPMMMGMMGGAGGAGYQGYTPTEFDQQMVTPSEGYQAFDYSTIGSGVDPAAVIAAQEYKLQEAMEGDMARAGGRAGASGFAMSTPYMGQLGEAARKASQDRNALTMQYQYDAAQAQAARDLAQQQQAAQLDFGGWQTGYQGDLQSQMFNAGQGMDYWSQMNQMGLAGNMQQNQMNQQNQMQQQQWLAQLMGGLL